MPTATKTAIERAIANVAAFGDTDVFPFPFENWFIKEASDQVRSALEHLDDKFDQLIEAVPPQFESTLAPAGYTGFRWVTSIDPYWNLYLLALVISAAQKIEEARIPIEDGVVFSYRYDQAGDARLFREQFGWAAFMTKSYELSQSYEYVVATDISEFYRRINHHRLENALQHIDKTQASDRIIAILSRFSQKASYGLPIGGPAARLLSELTINQIDKLLQLRRIKFARFADDYHLFAGSLDEAYGALQTLSEALITNQGLTLQKSKTRIMSNAEFQQSFPKHLLPAVLPDDELEADTIKLLKLSIAYDPYSATAADDYVALQAQLSEIDIVALLTAEAQKAQINLSISRRIVAVIKHLEPLLQTQAVATLLDNKEQFFPIMSNVLQVIYEISRDSNRETKLGISALVREAIASKTHVFGPALHLAYAVRILSESATEEDMLLLAELFDRAPPFLKRDIILVYAKARYWYPLSDLRLKYNGMTRWEQRAFYLASYTLGDEGDHWRRALPPADPLEQPFRRWCAKQKRNAAETIVRL